MFGDVPISQAWGWLLAACAAIVAIAKAWEIVKRFGKSDLKQELKKQAETIAAQQRKIEDAQNRIAKLEEANTNEIVLKHAQLLEKDEERLTALENASVIEMQALFALVKHALDGNDTTDLKSIQSKMQDYLIRK